MAEQGVLFKDAFTCQPVCGPARSCIQTGLYATQTGCYRNGLALPVNYKTIAHYLSERGYLVGYIGKWHLASSVWLTRSQKKKRDIIDLMTKPIPLERRGGYKDYWLASDLLEFTSHPFEGHLFNRDMEKVEFEGYRVDCLTDFALDFLDKSKNSQPFFLFLSYLEPHQQNDMEKFVGPKNSKLNFQDFPVPDDLKGNKGDWKENFPDYLGACNSIDKNLGRLENKMKELDLVDTTTIFFTSDHGCHFRTRNNEYKRSCHESSIHIPLVIKGPEFNTSKKIDKLVSLIDIAPTILRCANIEVPELMIGIPLQDLVNGEKEDWRSEIFIQISESQIGRAIRSEEWKYSIKAPGLTGFSEMSSEIYEEDFLYNLNEDPYEQNNLISNSKYNSIKTQLAKKLKLQMKKAGEKIPEIIPKNQ
jgi:uncharacterized sulfatase